MCEARGKAGTPLQELATAARLCGRDDNIVKMKLWRSQREKISTSTAVLSFSFLLSVSFVCD